VNESSGGGDEEQSNDPRLKECHDLWFGLFEKAFNVSSFDTLCTLLRPGAIHGAGWDVLDEADTTFTDFNWMVDVAQKAKGKSTARRFALYYYCFLVEMSAIHETMINVLRCLTGQYYLAFPFQYLYRRRKRDNRSIPPSMAQKINAVTELATQAGEADLAAKIYYVFDETLRNAVAHSDYILTADELRIREPGPGNSVPLKDVDQKVNYTFRFLSGLLKAANNMKYVLRHAKKYHKWDNYEVLELLADENGVYGFNVHFSNGNKSTFSRAKDGVTQINMRLQGGVGFMVGMVDRLEPLWKIDGVPVTDWDELSKRKALEA
jgi:hypothetical protein